jgi:hypothetical protein
MIRLWKRLSRRRIWGKKELAIDDKVVEEIVKKAYLG